MAHRVSGGETRRLIDPVPTRAAALLLGPVLCLLGLCASGQQPAVRPPPANPAAASVPTPPRTDAEERDRKAKLLAGDRWRRAMFELDDWLASQPVYSPAQVRRIKADLAARVAEMSSYELEYLLDSLDAKLTILESRRAREARDWLGRYYREHPIVDTS